MDRVRPNVPRSSTRAVNVLRFILAADDDSRREGTDADRRYRYPRGILVEFTHDGTFTRARTRIAHWRVHSPHAVQRTARQVRFRGQSASFIVTDPLLCAGEPCPRLTGDNGEEG